MSANSYIYRYLCRNNDLVIKSGTKLAFVLIIILVLLVIFSIFNPIKLINMLVDKKNEELASRNKVINCSDGRVINYTGNYPMPTSGVIVTEFGDILQPITPYTKYHSGVDISGKEYESVRAVESGIVTSIDLDDNSKYGKSIEIKHVTVDNVFYSYYANLSNIIVAVGDKVSQGDIIGKNGGTVTGHFSPGISTNRQMHFEIRTASGEGNEIDPRIYIL